MFVTRSLFRQHNQDRGKHDSDFCKESGCQSYVIVQNVLTVYSCIIKSAASPKRVPSITTNVKQGSKIWYIPPFVFC